MLNLVGLFIISVCQLTFPIQLSSSDISKNPASRRVAGGQVVVCNFCFDDGVPLSKSLHKSELTDKQKTRNLSNFNKHLKKKHKTEVDDITRKRAAEAEINIQANYS